MNQALYLECYSGISGDMTVAAFLDLGADPAILKEGLDSLGIEGYQIKISRVKKAGIDACDFAVLLDHKHENHDHDMDYLHGSCHQEAGHSKEPHTECPHHHETAHSHNQEQEHHHHEHRGLTEILEIIENSRISPRAKDIAGKIFTTLAKAEAKAHGVELSQVHFHEVGAVDSIVDIVAAAICLDNLNITDVIVRDLYEGQGCIRCQHGVIPVPVPAVINIAQQNHLSLHITSVQGELVTPTGAAIAASIRTRDTLPERFTIDKIGLGAGKRNYPTAGVLRAMLLSF